MVLKTDSFVEALSKMPDSSVVMDAAEAAISSIAERRDVPAEEREKAKRLFPSLLRIMKAKNAVEVEDIPLSVILECFSIQHLFEEYFCEKKAGTYFYQFNEKFNKIRTCRKRRVL